MNKTKISFLAILIFGNILVGFGQEPTQTVTPESKTTPQVSPTPSKVPPEILSRVKDLSDELIRAATLLKEGQKLAASSKNDSLRAKEKLLEAITIYQQLDTKLDNKSLFEQLKSFGEASQESLNTLIMIQFSTKAQLATALDGLAFLFGNIGDWQKNIEYLQKAVTAYQSVTKNNYYREVKIQGFDFINYINLLKFNETMALANLGGTFDSRLGQPEKGILYLNLALDGFRSLYKDTQNENLLLEEARTLFRLGLIYKNESRGLSRSIETLSLAIEIYRKFPNEKNEVANGFLHIGLSYAVNFDFVSAQKYYSESLKIYQELNNDVGQQSVYRQLLSMYGLLNEKTKVKEIGDKILIYAQAPDYFEKFKKNYGLNTTELKVFDELYALPVERNRLSIIGYVYEIQENYTKSLEYYLKAIEISQKLNEPADFRLDLKSVGFIYQKLEQWENALEYFNKALEISRTRNIPEEFADDLGDVGLALLEKGELREALRKQNEALTIYRAQEVGKKNIFSPRLSRTVHEIARTYNSLGNGRLAIFYGKQSVNELQNERKRIANFDLKLQKGFLEKKDKIYKRLVDWLIEAGRLVEAERVLEMLKEEEVSDYLRTDRSVAAKLSLRLEYTAEEEKAIKEYDQNSETIAAVGAEFGKFEDLKRNNVKLTPEQEKRFEELKSKLTEANQKFQNFLNQLAEEFKQNVNPAKDFQENKGLQADLAEWGEGVVFVSTLVGELSYRTILTTPDTQVPAESKIKSVDLNRKIIEFREQVKNPKIDPRPLGKELYDILVKPIENQLEGAKAKTILWSLDGNLRLLPLAALWDGKQYFGQKYQNVVITLASRSRIGREVSPKLNVLALGVSQAKTVAEPLGERQMPFSALPAVPFELASIVRTRKSPKGILPGESLLDEGFTKKNLEEQLVKGYKIVHIASHFSLNAGDANKSFLLLGDGTALTVNEFNSNPSLKFKGVELLTLSACETAVTGTDNTGKEIEGFAYVAQTNGAKAILATLWSVADNSTQLLMSEFYRLQKENPKLSKAEAIQLAQKAMIEGKLKANNAGNKKGAEIVGSATKTTAPTFQVEKDKPFAHPYYWSAFVLIGNWK